MTKNGTSKGAWAVGAAFVAFSAVVALSWTYGADLWTLRAVQDRSSGFLDAVLSVFSLLGGVEVAGLALLVLLAALFLNGHRAPAGRLLAIFVATGILEFVMKLYLPQVPIPEGVARTQDFAPLATADYSTYPYPSGHVLRGVIVFGALYLLSENRFLRIGSLVVLVGMAANRVYFGVHWASDVVGGALLGFAGLLWAFGKEDLGWRSR
jgi:undecaprenyl-diphosphatase